MENDGEVSKSAPAWNFDTETTVVGNPPGVTASAARSAAEEADTPDQTSEILKFGAWLEVTHDIWLDAITSKEHPDHEELLDHIGKNKISRQLLATLAGAEVKKRALREALRIAH